MKNFTTNSLSDLSDYVVGLKQRLSNKQIVLLSGDLGAGKTELVKQFVSNVTDENEVSSPSFAIINSYESNIGDIDHVDLYRLETESDLESTGFWDLFDKDSGVVFIEWANRLEDNIWPKSWDIIKINIKIQSDNSREITEEIL